MSGARVSVKTELIMKKISRISKYIACGCILLALCIFACSCGLFKYSDDDNSVPLSTPVELEYKLYNVVKGDIKREFTGTCKVHSTGGVEYSFDIGNVPLDKYYVVPGQTVKKGDVLASLKVDGMERAISDLENSIAVLDAEIAELEDKIRDAGWGSYFGSDRGTLENKRSEREQLQSKKSSYESMISKSKLRELKSTVDGTVRYVNPNYINAKRPDTLVQAGEVMVIVDSERLSKSEGVMVLDWYVSTKYSMGTGSMVILSTADKSMEFTGTILSTENTMNWNSQTVTYYIELKNAEKGTVKVGDTLNVRFEEDKDRQAIDVPIVPLSAIYSFEGRSFVYVLDSEGNRRECYVEVGLSDDTFIEIKAGLEVGDTIIQY